MAFPDILRNMQNIQAQLSSRSSFAHIVAVTKKQPQNSIEILLKANHKIFAENKVQEAKLKWPQLKSAYTDVELHMIGHLQTNKIKDAVQIFDVIETIDSFKLAKLLINEMHNQNKYLKCYLQINTGKEQQKSGILPAETDDFISTCINELGLPITGLMCISPLYENPASHFALLQSIAQKHNISTLSMGMSNCYKTAIKFGATHIRIGSAIFDLCT